VAAPKIIPTTPAFEPDDRQRQAIEHVDGPMLVVAGAGTGKTTVLTRRIARLIREQGVLPQYILATTYAENAAHEMSDRVQSELRGTNIAGLQAKTFHAYCNELLARAGKQFRVLDEKDLWIFLRRRIAEFHLDYFVRAANVGQFLGDLLSFMQRCQDELVTPERYAEYVAQLELGSLPAQRVSRSKDELSPEEVLGRCREISRVFTTVEQMLKADNLGSFGHMITHAHALLENDPALLAAERERTRYILVDEFQDANFAQVKILQMLAGETRNIFAVGDPDQAIYRFRGASSAAFGLFQHHFPGSKLVVLDKNRRSTTPILKNAFALISANPSTFPAGGASSFPYQRSPLVSTREEEAHKAGTELPSLAVDIVPLVDKTDKEVEAADLVQTIRERQKQFRCDWGDFAVIYRQHLHRDEVAEELSEAGIPFAIENMDVLATPDVRDVLACLGAVVSPVDGASLFRVSALPQFGIDPEKLRAGMKSAPKDSKGIAAVLAVIDGGSAVLETVRQTAEEIARAQAKGRKALDIVIRRFQLSRESMALDAFLDFVVRWETKPITESGSIGELVDYLADFREANGVVPLPAREENAVHLVSAHAAKGLEFDHVFIIRVNSGSFPCSFKEHLVDLPRELRDSESFAAGDDKQLDKEEERRLFYVAMTRARDTLTLYGRRGRGKTDPSPPGYLRDLLANRSLSPWIRQRNAHALQSQIFASATNAPSRTSEWLSMPPVTVMHTRLSPTAIETYKRCPLQFKLAREWNLPREVPAALHYGSVMHAVLKTYYESLRAGRPKTSEELLELFRASLADASIQERYQHDLYEKLGTKQLTAFFDACLRNPAPDVIHTEEMFEIQVGETTVAGRIDRMDRLSDGRVVVIDYKTGRSKSQKDADDSLQLSIYAMAAREKWQYDAGSLVFYNLEQNAAVSTTRSAAELDAVRTTVLDVAQKIADGKFEADPGFHCNFCPYLTLCPAKEKKLYTMPASKKAAHSRN